LISYGDTAESFYSRPKSSKEVSPYQKLKIVTFPRLVLEMLQGNEISIQQMHTFITVDATQTRMTDTCRR